MNSGIKAKHDPRNDVSMIVLLRMRLFSPLTLLMAAFVLMLSAPRRALGGSQFALDLGVYADNLSQRISAPGGFTSQVSTMTGLLRARPIVEVAKGVSFEPGVAVLVPWRNGANGFSKTITSFYTFDFGWNLFSRLNWRFGTGLQWDATLTQPQAVDLNNGTGTSTFFIPGGSSHSFQLLVETGLEFSITKSISFGAEAWISEVASNQRRRFAASLFLGVYL